MTDSRPVTRGRFSGESADVGCNSAGWQHYGLRHGSPLEQVIDALPRSEQNPSTSCGHTPHPQAGEVRMAAVLPLLPERHRAAPQPALLWTPRSRGRGSCAVAVLGASIRRCTSQRSVLLVSWVSLPFIFAGIVAWRRRPDSSFGPLLILAGFVTQLSTLQWTSLPLLNTVGQLSDLLVAALWLHVFLAYPTGRLPGRAERTVVIIGYVAAVGLQLVILMLGGFNDRHLLTVVKRQTAAESVQDVQLLTLSALALIGVVLLWRRWWALLAAAATCPDSDQLLQPVAGDAGRPAGCRRF